MEPSIGDGKQWSFPGLNGVYALDQNHVWVVGSIQGGFSSSILFFNGQGWVTQFDRFGGGTANNTGPTRRETILKPLGAVYASSSNEVYAVTKEAVVVYDGNRWQVKEVPDKFYWAVSGFKRKVIEAGWIQGHNNLTNNTTYQATVFNSP